MRQVAIFFERHQRGPAPCTKRNAMQRSMFDIGRADAGVGGMSISSGSGGASGMGASSSSSDASANGPFHGVFWSGLRLDVLGEELIVGVEWRGLFNGLVEFGVALCAQLTPSRVPDLVLGAEVLDCASRPVGRRLAPPCFVHGQAFEGATSAAEDGHVAWPCPREESMLVLLCSGSSRRPMRPRAAESLSSLLSRLKTSRGECAPARTAPARWRLSCQRVRSAPACPAGHDPC